MSGEYVFLDVGPNHVYTCGLCGAIVHNMARHDIWHRDNSSERYWVCLGANPVGGPFPSYDEADKERRHCIDGGTLTARLNPQIYSIRTDGFDANRPLLASESPVGGSL